MQSLVTCTHSSLGIMIASSTPSNRRNSPSWWSCGATLQESRRTPCWELFDHRHFISVMRLCFIGHHSRNLQPPYEELRMQPYAFNELIGDLNAWCTTILTPQAQRLSVLLPLLGVTLASVVLFIPKTT